MVSKTQSLPYYGILGAKDELKTQLKYKLITGLEYTAGSRDLDLGNQAMFLEEVIRTGLCRMYEREGMKQNSGLVWVMA